MMLVKMHYVENHHPAGASESLPDCRTEFPEIAQILLDVDWAHNRHNSFRDGFGKFSTSLNAVAIRSEEHTSDNNTTAK